MTEMLRAAIYIRVSTKLQEKKYSLEAQEYELTRYAKAQGWEIIGLFKDVESGGKLNKEGLDNLLDAVEDNSVDIVLCVDQDRLSRLDTVEWEFLKDVLRKHNVKIAEPGRITDLENEDDEFISDIKNLIAKREKRAIVRRMMRGKRQATREGKVWGKQPEEYIYDPVTKTISVNEDRSWIIPFIDDLYINKGYGAKRIAEELSKISKTSTGKEWTSRDVLRKLKRKAYHGVLVRKFSNGEIIEIPNVYPKLRSEEDYNRIQSLMKRKIRLKPAEPHMLRDIEIRCSACGRILTVKKNKETNHDGTEYKTFFILHGSNDSDSRNKRRCPVNPYINTKRVEKPLIEAVKSILDDEKNIKAYIDSGFDNEELKKVEAEIKRFKKTEQTLSEKMDRLLDLYLDGIWDKKKLDKQRSSIETELNHIHTLLEGLERKRELIQNKQLNYDMIVKFLGVAKNFETLLEEEEKQRLVGSLFPSATLDTENNTIIMHALLPNNAIIDFHIPIAPMEEVKQRELLDKARRVIDEAQVWLYHHRGASLETVAKAVNVSPKTLKKYQELIKPLEYLAPNKLSPKTRESQIEKIKEALLKNPRATLNILEQETGINRKRISQLIKEDKLR